MINIAAEGALGVSGGNASTDYIMTRGGYRRSRNDVPRARLAERTGTLFFLTPSAVRCTLARLTSVHGRFMFHGKSLIVAITVVIGNVLSGRLIVLM
ncbi:MAG TPA: hypothetical protein DEP05_05885 [Betaproteobacteria bacterium]|nr:hypothetical protein [Betaproteobacteria bacterium]